jgi:hypothetical protein
MTPPSTIDHYHIVTKFGEGGMGVVWRASSVIPLRRYPPKSPQIQAECDSSASK